MTSLISGTFNARDIGGLPTTSGSATASGVVIRSDALDGISEAGLQTLRDLAVGAVIDLRAAGEGAATHPLETLEGVTVVRIPLLEGAFTTPEGQVTDQPHIPTLGEIYVHLLENSGPELVRMADTVARQSSEGRATVIHCTAGKDRTGLSIALLLSLASVPREAILDDYHATEENLAGIWAEAMLAKVQAMGAERTPELETLVTGAPVDAMREALTWLDDHGGVEEYLRSSGLSLQNLNSLKSALVKS